MKIIPTNAIMIYSNNDANAYVFAKSLLRLAATLIHFLIKKSKKRKCILFFCLFQDLSVLTASGNRLDLCWQAFKSGFNNGVRDVIHFSKTIPGFPDLDIEDQVTLIKAGCFEVKLKLLSH